MRRVVITGMGIVSCLGNDTDSVTRSLREGRSGIRFKEDYKELGMRSHVAGTPEIALDDFIDRKPRRFMGDAAAYAYIAMQQAIADAGLEEHQVSNERTGLIAGSGGHSSFNQVEAADIARNRGVKRVGPYMVPLGDGVHRLGLPGHPVQDQGDQLLHCLRLRHQRALYWQRGGTDPAGQTGCGVRRRRRRRTLDAELPV